MSMIRRAIGGGSGRGLRAALSIACGGGLRAPQRQVRPTSRRTLVGAGCRCCCCLKNNSRSAVSHHPHRLLLLPAQQSQQRRCISTSSGDDDDDDDDDYNDNARRSSGGTAGPASFWSSKRAVADLEDRLHRAVGQKVRDPVLQQPLGRLQWLQKQIAVSNSNGDEKNGIELRLLLRPPSLLHPELEQLKSRVREEADQELRSWMEERSSASNDSDSSRAAVTVKVEVLPQAPVPTMARLVEDHDELLRSLGPGLRSVAHHLAVYSCKGGVGKSTVAANLAYQLAASGGRVGLLDLDLYGPSLPVLVRSAAAGRPVRRSPLGPGAVHPIRHDGVVLMSLGFVNARVS